MIENLVNVWYCDSKCSLLLIINLNPTNKTLSDRFHLFFFRLDCESETRSCWIWTRSSSVSVTGAQHNYYITSAKAPLTITGSNIVVFCMLTHLCPD